MTVRTSSGVSLARRNGIRPRLRNDCAITLRNLRRGPQDQSRSARSRCQGARGPHAPPSARIEGGPSGQPGAARACHQGRQCAKGHHATGRITCPPNRGPRGPRPGQSGGGLPDRPRDGPSKQQNACRGQDEQTPCAELMSTQCCMCNKKASICAGATRHTGRGRGRARGVRRHPVAADLPPVAAPEEAGSSLDPPARRGFRPAAERVARPRQRHRGAWKLRAGDREADLDRQVADQPRAGRADPDAGWSIGRPIRTMPAARSSA